MENADDLDAIVRRPVVDHVAHLGMAPVAWANMIAAPAGDRITHQKREGGR